jgi:hypothetical protein
MRLPLARLAVLAMVAAPSWAAAQGPDSVVVKVQIVDSANVAIAGVGVTIMEDLHAAIANGTTNNRGRVDVKIPRSPDQRELVARKIGLARGSSFFRANRDTIPVLMTMQRTAQQLAPVAINEREDVKRKSYHTDADEIAAFDRPLIDGMDILKKLKPDIMYGRSQGCGAQRVWINGKLIRYVPPDAMVQARKGVAAPMRRPRTTNSATNVGARGLPQSPMAGVRTDVLTIMAGIKAEHIAEINYKDCWEQTDVLNGNSAIYVVLKDGIGWDGAKTYVVENKKLPFKQAELMLPPEPAIPESTATKPNLPPLETPTPANAPYRRRLVGVFDENTGLPVADVEFVDVASGTVARTTITGTLTLAFLPEGQSQVEIRRVGYQPQKIEVSISPRDTLPLTLLLAPKKP